MSGKIGVLKIGMAVGLGGLQKGLKKATGLISQAVTGFGAIGLAATGLRVATDVLNKPFSLVNDLEQASAAFEVLTGSAETAGKLIAETQSLASRTSIGGAGNIQKAAKTMLGFGVATDKIMPSLESLSKITAGSPERFESLALAFSQSAAAGRLMGQDLLQMINAGFNPLQQMSKDTGKSLIELKKDMEEGLIPFSMVEQAFKNATSGSGQFAKMNEKMAGTMGGVFNQLSSKVSLAFTKISQTIFKALDITGLLKWASSMVDVVVPYIESFVSMLTGVFATIKAGSQPVIDWLYQRWVFAAGVIGKVWNNLYSIGAMVFNGIYSVISSVFPIFVGLSNVAGATLIFISDMLVKLAGWVGSVFTYIADWIGTNIISWNTFSTFITDALNVAEFALLNWKDVFAYVGVSIAAGLVSMFNDFVWFGENMIIQFKGMGQIVADYLIGWSKWVGNVFGNLFTNIVTIFKNLGPLIRGEMNLSDIWNPLTEGFKMEISKLPELTKREMGDMERSLHNQANGLAEKLGTGYDKFLADKKKMDGLKLPEIKKELKLDTTAAQTSMDALTPPAIDATGVGAKLGDKAQIGTKEGRDALIKHQMGAIDRSTPEKSAKDTAANTAEQIKQQKETNRLLRESNKAMNNQLTDTTVSFV